jgi:hypothetical protein
MRGFTASIRNHESGNSSAQARPKVGLMDPWREIAIDVPNSGITLLYNSTKP